jgi:hypothetical protein
MTDSLRITVLSSVTQARVPRPPCHANCSTGEFRWMRNSSCALYGEGGRKGFEEKYAAVM